MLTREQMNDSALETISKMQIGKRYYLSPLVWAETEKIWQERYWMKPRHLEEFIKGSDNFCVYWDGLLAWRTPVITLNIFDLAYKTEGLMGTIWTMALIEGNITLGKEVAEGNIPLKYSHLDANHPDFKKELVSDADIFLID
jgi:hypothetical protein